MRIHPIANCFLPLEDAELKGLADDIKQHGLRLPIITYEDAILDGRNRERACALAGVAPRYVEWRARSEGDTPLAFVTSVNLVRRHLNTSQRAAIAAELATMKSGTRTDLPPKGGRSISQPEAAKAMGVSTRSVQRAAAIRKKNPVQFAAMKRGRITKAAAARQSLEAQRKIIQGIAQGNGITTCPPKSKVPNLLALLDDVFKTEPAAFMKFVLPRLERMVGECDRLRRVAEYAEQHRVPASSQE